MSIQTYSIDGLAQHSLGALSWYEGETITEAVARTEETKHEVPHMPDLELRRIALELAEEHVNLNRQIVALDQEIVDKYEGLKDAAEQVGQASNHAFVSLKHKDSLAKDLERVKEDEQRMERFSIEQQERLNEWAIASKNAITTFVCGSLWLNQKITTVTQAPLTRAAQRRLERQKIDPKCLVVELRSKQYTRTTSDDESKQIDWAWQWAVRGHWREQPTKDGIKLIWIHPYIKGPDDKPLKPDAGRVFAVTR